MEDICNICIDSHMEKIVCLANIGANNTTTIPLPISAPESDIKKIY